MIRPADYNDGLDADGFPADDGSWGFSFKQGDETAHGAQHPRQIGEFIPIVIERADNFAQIYGATDSPIEDMLGAAILMAARAAGVSLRLCREKPLPNGEGFLLVPQARWGIYRSDWAIISRATKMALLIECDGKEFHSSPEQREHDRKKDQAAHDRGYLTMRFTGAEINRDADGIAHRIMELLKA